VNNKINSFEINLITASQALRNGLRREKVGFSSNYKVTLEICPKN